MPDVFTSPTVLIQPETIPVTDPLPKRKHQPSEKMTPFATFCRFPEGVRFQNQEEGEDVHLVVRRHFITNIPWILTGIGFSLLPLVFFLFAPFFDSNSITISPIAILFLLLFYYLIIFGYLLVNYTTWFYHVGIVTNMRVLDIDIENISTKNVAATNISGIVDVEYSQGGILSNFFDFGNVNLQTEGLKPNFEFIKVPKPARVTDIISDLIAGRKSND